ncbi:MAG: hypothetical protein AB1349_08755 [Elusimicrobiota bacterium]
MIGPNYFSPINNIDNPFDNSSVKNALLYILRNVFRMSFYKNSGRIIKKEVGIDNKIYFRELQVENLTGSGGDEDAVFYMNPVDIINMLKKNGFRIDFFSSFGFRSKFINRIIKIINLIPFIRHIGWGTTVIATKIRSNM